MIDSSYDPVIDALGRLSAAPPRDLVGLVYSDWVRMPGPVGDLYVAFTHNGVSYIRTAESANGDDSAFAEAFRGKFGRPLRRVEQPPAGLRPALQRRTGARNVPVDLNNVTAFERAVLETTRRIPHGQTRPYSWVAREIGRPRAVRAVGTALGNNPVPVLIPCHRVVRADGELGGYVFGRDLKETLLRVEGANLDEMRDLARENVFYLGSDVTGIVCFPSCAHARRITEPHRRGFRSIKAATHAGYRPCKHCRPAMAVSA